MSKPIGIIFDVVHPLLEKICERLSLNGADAELVHWTSLAHGQGMKEPLERFGAVYLDRMGEQSRSYATQLSLLTSPAPIVNTPAAYTIARNKALTAARLRELNIPAPPTAVVYNQFQLETFTRANPSDHYVVKSIYGCCAYDIYPFAWGTVPHGLETLLARDGMAVAQTFIRNSERFIWRIDVVEGEVIVCNQRFAYNASEDTPICNGTQGGEIRFWQPSELPANVRELALGAVKSLGLSIAGVDILPSDDGELLVLEVNPEPDITLDRYEFPYAIADYLRSLT